MASQPASNGVPDLSVFYHGSARLLVKGARRVTCRSVPVGMGGGKQITEDLGVAGPLGCVGVGSVGRWRVCKLKGAVGPCVAVSTWAGGLDGYGRVEATGADPAEEEEEEACEEGDAGYRRRSVDGACRRGRGDVPMLPRAMPAFAPGWIPALGAAPPVGSALSAYASEVAPIGLTVETGLTEVTNVVSGNKGRAGPSGRAGAAVGAVSGDLEVVNDCVFDEGSEVPVSSGKVTDVEMTISVVVDSVVTVVSGRGRNGSRLGIPSEGKARFSVGRGRWMEDVRSSSSESSLRSLPSFKTGGPMPRSPPGPGRCLALKSLPLRARLAGRRVSSLAIRTQEAMTRGKMPRRS